MLNPAIMASFPRGGGAPNPRQHVGTGELDGPAAAEAWGVLDEHDLFVV